MRSWIGRSARRSSRATEIDHPEDRPHMTRMPAIGLQHPRFALAANDCGSLRTAADMLAVRHSVVSRSITQLEHLIGAALFERSSGGIKPNLTGRTFCGLQGWSWSRSTR